MGSKMKKKGVTRSKRKLPRSQTKYFRALDAIAWKPNFVILTTTMLINLATSVNIACVSPQSSVKNPSPSSSSDSPTSRKHSRDGSIITQANSQKEKHDAGSKESENGVLIPKTLRIDDPTEAAKSFIWSTLGIKNGKANYSFNACVGLLNAIPSKGNNQNHHPMVEVLPVLHANLAALSRSVAFHEQQA